MPSCLPFGARGAVWSFCLFSSAALAAGPQDSVAYQINAAHNGNIVFSQGFAPPLKQLWAIDLGGPVSYPLVAGTSVFVSVGNTVGGGEQLYALDLKTGATKWSRAFGDLYTTGNLAYDAGRVIFTNGSGALQAFAASSGKALWSTQLGRQNSFNFYPIVSGGYVYTGVADNGFAVYQVDAATGAVGWQSQLPGPGAGATAGDGYIFFPVPCELSAYVAQSGQLVWNYEGGGGCNGGQVSAYWKGRLYAAGANYPSGAILDAKTGAAVGSFSGSAPAFDGKLSYSIVNGGVLAAKVTTGLTVWQFKPTEALLLPPIVVNGTVFALGIYTGNVYALSGSTGKLLQTLAVGVGPYGTSQNPGLGAGRGVLVVPSGSKLVAFAP